MKESSKKSGKKMKRVATKKAAPVVHGHDLVIVESPSKAKTIKKYLGRGYQVVASNGHIKDLPKSKLGVDVKKGFEIELVPINNKKDKIKKIQEMAKEADKIFLAPDPDREGEAIAFHLAEEIGGKKKRIYRVLFNAITKNAVQAAIKNPKELDQNKYDSQKTRRILDRLVGYKISPILWEKVQRGLSAGRVQSVALRVIVEREDLIKVFKPEQWFSIHVPLKKDNTDFEANYYGETRDQKRELNEEKTTKKILQDIKDTKLQVIDVKKRERRQNPTPPFTTSKLQQEAANKLGFTTKRTMMVAQKLYEGVQLSSHGLTGLITYMRTDSVRTEPEALNSLREFIKDRYGKENVAAEPIIYSKKGGGKVQDAHEAIRPTHFDLPPELVKNDLPPDEHKLYSLIWNKFISSQMSPAVIDQTTITFEAKGHYFKSNGSIIKFPGFRTVYLEALADKKIEKGQDEEEINLETSAGVLPDIKEGEYLKPTEAPKSEEHWTAPPARYSEATLVKELEENGIGRPSTYASIIANVQDRGYVEKIENRFRPTELGDVVCRMLIKSFPDVMDVEFTAKLEARLDEIEEGEIQGKSILKVFWKDFEKTLATAQEEMKNLRKQEIPTGIKCRKCKEGEYHIKWGRNGQFFACSKYPECNSTEDFKKSLAGVLEIIEKEYAKDKCPKCGHRMFVKKGPYGRFLACEEYPNCETTLPYLLDVHCPECKKGRFAEKKSRYGKIFYGCSSYPECHNAMWSLPRAHECPSCKYPVMGQRITKRGGEHLECPKCKSKVPIEETPFK